MVGSGRINVLKRLVILCALTLGSAAFAADGAVTTEDPVAAWEADRTIIFEALEIDLAAFKWVARPVVVFADTPADPAFAKQIELLQARIDEMVERDVVLITDTDPAARSDLRTALRPRAFMLALIGRDGQIKLRKPAPWDVRELSRSIDKMPLRQQEMRDRRGTDG